MQLCMYIGYVVVQIVLCFTAGLMDKKTKFCEVQVHVLLLFFSLLGQVFFSFVGRKKNNNIIDGKQAGRTRPGQAYRRAGCRRRHRKPLKAFFSRQLLSVGIVLLKMIGLALDISLSLKSSSSLTVHWFSSLSTTDSSHRL